MINPEILDSIYIKYGYKIKKRPDIRIYLLSEGMYHGAEIIKLTKNVSTDEVSTIYKELGYAVHIHEYENIEDAELELFRGFFNTKQLKLRIGRRYNEFCKSQELQLIENSKYQYVNTKYRVFNPLDFLSENSLINDVLTLLSRPGAYFIIIEAAAGFGKTCTSYEILKTISENLHNKIPLFTELSRDRQAKIFRYVLYSAIDSEFHNMIKRELVEYQIKAGRIPLIVDGFDELLTESSEKNKSNESFGQVETMLGTLSSLMTDNSKVILTTRKTAIFSSKEFQDWADGFENKFTVVRFIIEPPRLRDWLDEEKYGFIKKDRDNLITNIANPVLLNYLRFLGFEDFKNLLSTPSEIVDKYFTALLEREQLRQELFLSKEEQLDILETLAQVFTEYKIYAERKELVKELLIDYNKVKLEKLKKSTPGNPKIEELADKLTNHATLDRLKGRGENIGFINDFIFGTLIGLAIINDKLNNFGLNNIDQSFAELSVISFKFQNEIKRQSLYDRLNKIKKFSGSFSILLQINLTKKLKGIFDSQELNGFYFEKIDFDDDLKVTRCVFNECKFYNCKFDRNLFQETSFLGCLFNDCEVIESSPLPYSVSIFGCQDYNSGFINLFENNDPEEEVIEAINYDSIIFSFLFKVDRLTPKMSFINSIKDGTQYLSVFQQKMLFRRIHRLGTDGLLRVDGNSLTLTRDGRKFYFEQIKPFI